MAVMQKYDDIFNKIMCTDYVINRFHKNKKLINSNMDTGLEIYAPGK